MFVEKPSFILENAFIPCKNEYSPKKTIEEENIQIKLKNFKNTELGEFCYFFNSNLFKIEQEEDQFKFKCIVDRMKSDEKLYNGVLNCIKQYSAEIGQKFNKTSISELEKIYSSLSKRSLPASKKM